MKSNENIIEICPLLEYTCCKEEQFNILIVRHNQVVKEMNKQNDIIKYYHNLIQKVTHLQIKNFYEKYNIKSNHKSDYIS